MSTVVNTGTLAIRRSVNTPDYPSPTWEVLTNAAADAAEAIPGRYRKWVDPDVVEMTQGEKDVVDAAAVVAADDGQMAGFEGRNALQALALVLLDRINALEADHGRGGFTGAQLKAAFRAKLETL